jgi:uncharacterized protein with von Willebrand factor type A (vWA) domain
VETRTHFSFATEVTSFTGKQTAKRTIDELSAGGGTNLASANSLALSHALSDCNSDNIHVLILTDGEPDNAHRVLPEFLRCLVPLERSRAAGQHHGVCISTFGYGYDMNSVSHSPFLCSALCLDA